jgi:tetratricopeptide (TPR) repeat protein
MAALGADPSALTDAYLKRAEKLVGNRKDQEAEALFALALTRDASVKPKIEAVWTEAYVKRGEKMLGDGRDQEAEDLFALAISREPTLDRRINEARVRIATNRGSHLVAIAKSSAERHEAIIQLDRAITTAKGAGILIDKYVFEVRGKAYLELNQYDNAISDFEQAKRLGSPIDNSLWWATFRKGNWLSASGSSIEGLLTIWTNLLDIKPEVRRTIEQRELLVSGFWTVISRIYVALPTSSQAATVTQCDRLTSHSEDPLRIAAGVPFDSIDAPSALSACNEAVKDHPGEPRYLYLRGRAYARAASISKKVKDEVATKAHKCAALTDYEAAMAKGYPIAFNNMAVAFEEGSGVAKNEVRTQGFQLQTLNRVLYCCWVPVARHLLAAAPNSTFDIAAVYRVVGAITLWSLALGSPDAHSLLNELVAKGIVAGRELPSSAQFSDLPPWLQEFPFKRQPS